MELVGLAEYSQRRGWSPNRGLKAVTRGEIRALKIAGRWIVLVPDLEDGKAPAVAPTPAKEK